MSDNLEIDIDKKTRREIAKLLGDLKKKTPRVIAKAANETAKVARPLLANMARVKYTVNAKYLQAEQMEIKKAKVRDPTATIKVSGGSTNLYQFDVTPKTLSKKRKEAPKARVLYSSGMKTLQTGNLKAFIVKFASGHKAIAQRTGTIKTGKKNRFARECKVLLSPSLPTMIGNEKNVFGPLRAHINEIFRECCLREIQKIVEENKAGDTK